MLQGTQIYVRLSSESRPGVQSAEAFRDEEMEAASFSEKNLGLPLRSTGPLEHHSLCQGEVSAEYC